MSPAPVLTIWGWVVLAAVNLGYTSRALLTRDVAGVPLSDYWEVRGWLDFWHLGAANPYLNPAFKVDYPPHAFFVLWPFQAFLPPALAGTLFVGISVGLYVVAAWWLVRAVADISEVSLTRLECAGLAAMLLATRSVRLALLYGQTYPIALVFFAVALRAARRHPGWAGVALALGSFKLNVAAGFAVMFVLLRRLRPVLVAGAVVAALTVAFGILTRVPALDLVRQYLATFTGVYAGAGSLGGITEFYGLAVDLLPGETAVRVVTVAFYVAATLALALAAWRARRDRATAVLVVVATLLWNLTCFPNQDHNVILLVPALWVLVWPDFDVVRRGWLRWGLATLGLAYTVGSVPQAIETLFNRLVTVLPGVAGLSGPELAEMIVLDGLRVLVLALFAVFLLALRRQWRLA